MSLGIGISKASPISNQNGGSDSIKDRIKLMRFIYNDSLNVEMMRNRLSKLDKMLLFQKYRLQNFEDKFIICKERPRIMENEILEFPFERPDLYDQGKGSNYFNLYKKRKLKMSNQKNSQRLIKNNNLNRNRNISIVSEFTSGRNLRKRNSSSKGITKSLIFLQTSKRSNMFKLFSGQSNEKNVTKSKLKNNLNKSPSKKRLKNNEIYHNIKFILAKNILSRNLQIKALNKTTNWKQLNTKSQLNKSKTIRLEKSNKITQSNYMKNALDSFINKCQKIHCSIRDREIHEERNKMDLTFTTFKKSYRLLRDIDNCQISTMLKLFDYNKKKTEEQSIETKKSYDYYRDELSNPNRITAKFEKLKRSKNISKSKSNLKKTQK